MVSKVSRGLTSAALLVGLAGGSCKREEPTPPARPPVEATGSPCEKGRSDDPPRAELLEAERLLRSGQHTQARAFLDGLLQQKPNSVIVLALRGDASLFDGAEETPEAAREARGYYERAEKLLNEGCKVPRRVEYYLLLGQALSALRLAGSSNGQFDETELERASKALVSAEQKWPRSAEIHYNLARVECARPADVDVCLRRFEQALEAAESLERPRFLRAHRSTEDWIVRSETQPEFVRLRADAGYAKCIQEARARSVSGNQKAKRGRSGPAPAAD